MSKLRDRRSHSRKMGFHIQPEQVNRKCGGAVQTEDPRPFDDHETLLRWLKEDEKEKLEMFTISSQGKSLWVQRSTRRDCRLFPSG